MASEQDAVVRQPWWETVSQLDPTKLVFLDETSTPTTLTPLRARSPRGTRAVGRVPRRHWEHVTLLATLTPNGMGEALVIDGAANRAFFDAFIIERLVPTLSEGQTVILDNLSVHKSEVARAAIEAAGCHLCFLPPYSPDFNPIELTFAKIKQHLRRAEARTYDEILAASKGALNAVTATDAANCYRHAGYALPKPPEQPL